MTKSQGGDSEFQFRHVNNGVSIEWLLVLVN